MTFDTSVATSDDFGTRTAPDAITFHRSLNAPIERVWKLLTSPEGLATWLGQATVDPRRGGDFIVQLTDDILMHGRLLELDAPRRLVISWRELENGASTGHATTEDDVSELSFALKPVDGRTHLTLVHRLILAGEPMNGFGAGWHAFLDTLQAVLEGRPRIDPHVRYKDLRDEYVERLRA